MRVVLALFLSIWGATASAEKVRVLFVGNSYTFAHDVPDIVKQMAALKGHELEYEQQTPGGRTFQQHWDEGKAVAKMTNGTFDVVVLQNQSFEPVINPDNMMKYGEKLAEKVDEIGARKVYYLTPAYAGPVNWMKKDNDQARRGLELLPEMDDRIAESYTRLARETRGDIAPVGVAWKRSYTAMPDFRLHASDNSHAGPNGAYLTALVFYATLFNEPPVDMPCTLTIAERKKGKSATTELKIDPKTRAQLEKIAWEARSDFLPKSNRE